jgi:preprotein translocase subunit SecG
MMTIFLGFLTVVMVLNSAFLILLVLIQLPKKEAGAGIAFGGSATETLFGAGTGTVLTKATKYSAGLFMGLSLLLAIANSHAYRKTSTTLDEELQRLAGAQPVIAAPAISNTVPAITPVPTPAPAVAPTVAAPAPTLLLSSTNTAPATSPAPQTRPPQ